MKLKELPINQKVSINSFEYVYLGINKVRLKGIGMVQKVVFKSQNPKVEDKYFDLSTINQDVKKLNIKVL